MDEDTPPSAQALISTVPGSMQGALTGNTAKSDDTGDAFELSQLLFVVGHVAVKHIVYLELVEREWKCQKQVKELGVPETTLRVRSLTRLLDMRRMRSRRCPDSPLALYGPLLVRICGALFTASQQPCVLCYYPGQCPCIQ
ncbi:hypothetical protein BGW80DRAFT_911242 [Lactifluus volemus]|nr:hypothetical protein BGW80DRAFT_911242 [Lactifluus volemus]